MRSLWCNSEISLFWCQRMWSSLEFSSSMKTPLICGIVAWTEVVSPDPFKPPTDAAYYQLMNWCWWLIKHGDLIWLWWLGGGPAGRSLVLWKGWVVESWWHPRSSVCWPAPCVPVPWLSSSLTEYLPQWCRQVLDHEPSQPSAKLSFSSPKVLSIKGAVSWLRQVDFSAFCRIIDLASGPIFHKLSELPLC